MIQSIHIAGDTMKRQVQIRGETEEAQGAPSAKSNSQLTSFAQQQKKWQRRIEK